MPCFTKQSLFTLCIAALLSFKRLRTLKLGCVAGLLSCPEPNVLCSVISTTTQGQPSSCSQLTRAKPQIGASVFHCHVALFIALFRFAFLVLASSSSLGILAHHTLKLRPQRFDRLKFATDLSPISIGATCADAGTNSDHALQIPVECVHVHEDVLECEGDLAQEILALSLKQRLLAGRSRSRHLATRGFDGGDAVEVEVVCGGDVHGGRVT
jgi:hypothetical protein